MRNSSNGRDQTDHRGRDPGEYGIETQLCLDWLTRYACGRSLALNDCLKLTLAFSLCAMLNSALQPRIRAAAHPAIEQLRSVKTDLLWECDIAAVLLCVLAARELSSGPLGMLIATSSIRWLTRCTPRKIRRQRLSFCPVCCCISRRGWTGPSRSPGNGNTRHVSFY